MKSPPELWALVSDPASLAKHLGEFGEIRITRLDPETTVAWEGETACGTVEIESSGWGTKVILTAEPAVAEATSEPAAEEAADAAAPTEPAPVAAEPEPEAADSVAVEPQAAEPPAGEPQPAPRKRGFFARLFRRNRPAAETIVVEPELEPEPVASEPEPVPEPVASEPVPEPEPVASEPEPDAAPEPAPVAAAPAPEPRPAIDEERALAVLTGALDGFGAAHHRPFSRG